MATIKVRDLLRGCAPGRLQGVAVIPLSDIDRAIAETRRVVEQLGFPGINVYPDAVDGRMLPTELLDIVAMNRERLDGIERDDRRVAGRR